MRLMVAAANKAGKRTGTFLLAPVPKGRQLERTHIDNVAQALGLSIQDGQTRAMAGEVQVNWNGTTRPDNSRRVERSESMLSQCANSKCRKPFLRLREGKLFLVETDRLMKPGQSIAPPFVRARQAQRRVEHYWLCDSCAADWTLIYDRERGVALAPLPRPATSVALATTASASGVA